MHGGSAPPGRKNGARLKIEDEARQHAERITAFLGTPIDVDPLEALLHMIRTTAGEFAYYTDCIAELDPDTGVVNNEPHLWIRLRHEAIDRIAKMSKMAIDAGVAERQVANAERIGTLIGKVFQAMLADLNLTPEQHALAPEVMRRHLMAVAG